MPRSKGGETERGRSGARFRGFWSEGAERQSSAMRKCAAQKQARLDSWQLRRVRGSWCPRKEEMQRHTIKVLLACAARQIKRRRPVQRGLGLTRAIRGMVRPSFDIVQRVRDAQLQTASEMGHQRPPHDPKPLLTPPSLHQPSKGPATHTAGPSGMRKVASFSHSVFPLSSEMLTSRARKGDDEKEQGIATRIGSQWGDWYPAAGET